MNLRRVVNLLTGKRSYKAAKSSRLLFSASTSSANTELYTSLASLRDRSRALIRDEVYAKRAKEIVINNVIGPGVGVQAQVKSTRGNLMRRINSDIESAWADWCESDRCHTGATLHFSDLERLAIGEVFESGECFIRLHSRRIGESKVPLALELIESERIADDHELQPPPGALIQMGVEQDDQGRPLAYYVHRQHPNQLRILPGRRLDQIDRIPADEMMHLRLVERWPQARGVPWLHASITRLHQLGEFENAAVIAARVGASMNGFFEYPEWPDQTLADGEESDGTPSRKLEPGEFMTLPEGYKFHGWDPSYPHENFDPFLRACLRGIGAGTNVSYESLSRDYSQSNYSSSRLSLLDDRDVWRVLQQWWIRAFRRPLHHLWLQRAALSGSIPSIDRTQYAENPSKFSAVKFKPRGWGWVDPAKEVAAYKEAERAGYKTKSDIVAETNGGLDLEDVINARRLELDMLADAGLTTDTTSDAEPQPENRPSEEQDEDLGASPRMRVVNA